MLRNVETKMKTVGRRSLFDLLLPGPRSARFVAVPHPGILCAQALCWLLLFSRRWPPSRLVPGLFFFFLLRDPPLESLWSASGVELRLPGSLGKGRGRHVPALVATWLRADARDRGRAPA